MSDEAKEYASSAPLGLINEIVNILENMQEMEKGGSVEEISSDLKDIFKQAADKFDMKIGAFMKYVRVFLTGQVNSPSMFNMIVIIGKEESLRRIGQQAL